ncbi:MAG: class I SAM-dependent rRNA methyltransferase [Flavobacteriales bacterium]
MEKIKAETKRIAVKLKSAAERKLRQGHPWVFEGSITKESDVPNSGDLAIIYDHRSNKLMSLALYDCESPIRLKVIQQGGAQLNQNWFDEKIQNALSLRKSVISENTNSYRLVFGEADGLPGVICDVYNGHAVLKLYSAAWFPYLDLLCNAITSAINATCLLLRLSRNSTSKAQELGLADGQVLYGTLEDEEVEFKEHGIHFSANLVHGHKTGFFLDHRANRKRVGELAKGKTVLDIFSYAGGFSIHALCGGAERVLSADISEPALDLAKKNAELNNFQGFHDTLKAEAFRMLERMADEKEKFDLIIIDPPSFAKQKSEVNLALDQYRRLAQLGSQLVNSGGILVLASCSSRVTPEEFFQEVERAFSDHNVNYELLETHGHDKDHPIITGFPEGEYLKCAYYEII